LSAQKRTARTARNKVRPPTQDPRQIDKAGETSIVALHICGLQMCQLLARQFYLSYGAGFQPAIQAHTIEQIIEHRQSRFGISCASRPVLIGRFFPPERTAQFLAIRQAHQRAIRPYQPMPPPASHWMLRAIDGGQNALTVQLGKSAVLEFGLRGGHRPSSDRPKDLSTGPLIEQLAQMPL